MNITIHPMLADGGESFLEAMNKIHFLWSCTLAVSALLASLLPRRWKYIRLLSIGLAIASIYWIVQLVRLNSPQWQPSWVLMWPVLVSLVAIGLSVRTLLHPPKHDAA